MRAPAIVSAVCAVVLLNTGVVSLGQQAPPRDARTAALPVGTSTISGVVVADETPARPLRLATVTLAPAERAAGATSWFTATDAGGRFSFSSLPAGRYTLTVSKPPYVTNYYGSRRPGSGPGTPIAVAADQTLPLTVKMQHGAAIEGRVLGYDSALGPVGRVQLMQWRMSGGERTLAPAVAASGQLDDLGTYRIFGLPPGDYVVMFSAMVSAGGGADLRRITAAELQWADRQFQASGSGGALGGGGDAKPPDRGPAVALAPVYYPGTTDPSAAITITLGPGEERAGVDLALNFVPTATIAGEILGPDGVAPTTVQANLIGLGSAGAARGSVFLRPTPDGKFSTSGVAPGSYVLVVRAAPRPAPGAPVPPPAGRGASTQVNLPLWASEELAVDGRDLTGLTIRLQPGMSVSGRVSFEASTLPVPADLTTVRVSLTAVASRTGVTIGVPAVSAAADGTFEITGVAPGNYRLSASMPGMASTPSPASTDTWMVKSAMVAGQDALDAAFAMTPGSSVAGAAITITDRVSELSGSLIDPGGRPAPDYLIVAFSTDRRMWGQNSRQIRQARPATDGRYRMPALPAGEYYVCALTDIEPGQLNDDTFLEQLIGASIKIAIGDGEKKVQDLKISGGPSDRLSGHRRP